MVRVVIRSYDKTILVFDFYDVQSVRENKPQGMMIYSLSEMSNPAPFRHFEFTNWDEDDPRYLGIVARDFRGYAMKGEQTKQANKT